MMNKNENNIIKPLFSEAKDVNHNTNNNKSFQFGDVIYRPCISYAGMKNFINVSVVRSVIHREDGDYILSYDAFRQSWTDHADSHGITFFTDRHAAEVALAAKMQKKVSNA